MSCGSGEPSIPPGAADHEGPAWTPGSLVLVASGTPYRALAEVPLRATTVAAGDA